MPIFYENENHVLIHTESNDDWDSFLRACDGYLNDKHFDMLHNYLGGIVKSIIIEKNYYDADYRDTYYNFFARKFAHYPSTAIRANFFNDIIPEIDIFELDKYQHQYLGFSVIRPNRINPIGRTVLNPKMLPCIPGYVCTAKYPVHILGAELTAVGFPYISQDSDVTVCAHASCWMIFRYFSQKYNRYSEIWPYELTQLTSNTSYGRLVPSRGLTAGQVTEMFSKFGFFPELYIREHMEQELFDYILYLYIESGLPVVAGLTKQLHAITIIGHTLNTNIKDPVTPGTTYQYLTGLIANDDNNMPYQKIQIDDTRTNEGHNSKYKLQDIDLFVVPLYEKVHLYAEHVVQLTDAILSHTYLGINENSTLVTRDEVILRIFLTSSKSFKKVIRQTDIPFGISKVYCQMEMPKFIWVCEISNKEYYKDKKIFGEIIFDATANKKDTFAFLSIHYPEILWLNDRGFLTDDPKRFTIRTVETDKINAYNCYINNLSEA